MFLYLVRHGQSTNNATPGGTHVADPLLTPLGEEQAGYAGDALRSAGLTALHASPMRRAMATAAIIGAKVGLPTHIAAELCEMDGVNTERGLSRNDILALYPTATLSDSVTDTGWWIGKQETPEQVAERAKRVAENLRSLYGDQPAARIALVTHGTFASYLLRYYLGLPTLDRWFYHVNAGISLLEFAPDVLKIRYVNYTNHLPPDKVTP